MATGITYDIAKACHRNDIQDDFILSRIPRYLADTPLNSQHAG